MLHDTVNTKLNKLKIVLNIMWSKFKPLAYNKPENM